MVCEDTAISFVESHSQTRTEAQELSRDPELGDARKF